MKVMLIWPLLTKKGRKAPLLGLASMAACLNEVGHSVKILDNLISGYQIEDIFKEIKNFNPDVVGISSHTQFIYDAYKVAEITKKYNPNCLTVIGGTHPSVLSKETLQECSFLDVVVRGEGEITFVKLIEKFEKGIGFDDVLGITFRRGDGVVFNADRPLIQDLDSLPFPAYHLLPMNKYVNDRDIPNIGEDGKKRNNFATVLSSRGCPYNCIFCSSRSVWGDKWRSRSPEKVIEELKILREKYNVKVIDFADDTFTVNKNRTEKICELIIKEDVDIHWACSSRVELVNNDLINLFKDSKCFMVNFGLESGVQETLDFLCKSFKINDSMKAVRIVNEAGLLTSSNFIIGVPGETKEKINQTIKFAKKINLTYSYIVILTPFPGTKIYEYAIKHNLLLTKDWSKYNITTPVMKIPGLSNFDIKGLFFKANINHIIRKLPFFKIFSNI